MDSVITYIARLPVFSAATALCAVDARLGLAAHTAVYTTLLVAHKLEGVRAYDTTAYAIGGKK